MAGMGFKIPDNPIIMSEMAVSLVMELVMMISFVAVLTTQP